MIEQLTSPSVCLIDDEAEDYGPMLKALFRLGVACIHFTGSSHKGTPKKPLADLQLVFMDLHLQGSMGKTATAHAVNVFTKTVSPKAGPVVVVIWSKYANDPPHDLPPEDEATTEVGRFKTALKETMGDAYDRLIMLVMPKPHRNQRPANDRWVRDVANGVKQILGQRAGIGLLWSWEKMAKDAAGSVCGILTTLALGMARASNAPATDDGGEPLNENIKQLMKLLAQSQGASDCSPKTAARYLIMTMNQLAQDQLEHFVIPKKVDEQGAWLSNALNANEPPGLDRAELNAMLLSTQSTGQDFKPGTVYEVENASAWERHTGLSLEELRFDCCVKGATALAELTANSTLVLVELTPSCDYAHVGKRKTSVLMAGLAVNEAALRHIKTAGTTKIIPQPIGGNQRNPLTNRFATPQKKIGFVFCSMYPTVLPLKKQPKWIKPMARLRETVAMDVRYWASSQAARVGYLSV